MDTQRTAPALLKIASAGYPDGATSARGSWLPQALESVPLREQETYLWSGEDVDNSHHAIGPNRHTIIVLQTQQNGLLSRNPPRNCILTR